MRTQYTELLLVKEAVQMAQNTLLSINNPADEVLSALDFLGDILCGLDSEQLLGRYRMLERGGNRCKSLPMQQTIPVTGCFTWMA